MSRNSVTLLLAVMLVLSVTLTSAATSKYIRSIKSDKAPTPTPGTSQGKVVAAGASMVYL